MKRRWLMGLCSRLDGQGKIATIPREGTAALAKGGEQVGYIEQNLLAGETVVYRAKLHWVIFVWPVVFLGIALLLALAAFSGGSWGGGVIFLVAGLLIVLSVYINFMSCEFGVTTRRVLIKVGVLRRRSLELLLSKVESIGVDQGIVGRLLGYGTIIVTGTGGTKDPFRMIAAPLEFRRMVQKQTE